MCEFKLEVAEDRDTYVIGACGELDLSNCSRLELALVRAEQSRARRILLDLEELTFIDSSGLQTLLKASRRSASNGGRLRMTKGNGNVAAMFQITALDLTLPLIDPPSSAPSGAAS